jgi:hypothetical protein
MRTCNSITSLAAASTVLLAVVPAMAQDDEDVEVEIYEIDVHQRPVAPPADPTAAPSPPPPAVTPVSADEMDEDDLDDDDERVFPEAVIMTDVDYVGRPEIVTGIGLGLTIGGGVTGFIDDDVQGATQVGGAWDARLTIGTRSLLAAEIGYLGGAQSIDALGLDNDAVLLTNGAEAALRLNILAGIVQPYILAGGGWTHFRLVNSDFNTSAIEDSDNAAHFPLGGGLGVRYEGLLIDARGVVRPVVDDELFAEQGAGMHSWEAKMSAGAEF